MPPKKRTNSEVSTEDTGAKNKKTVTFKSPVEEYLGETQAPQNKRPFPKHYLLRDPERTTLDEQIDEQNYKKEEEQKLDTVQTLNQTSSSENQTTELSFKNSEPKIKNAIVKGLVERHYRVQDFLENHDQLKHLLGIKNRGQFNQEVERITNEAIEQEQQDIFWPLYHLYRNGYAYFDNDKQIGEVLFNRQEHYENYFLNKLIETLPEKEGSHRNEKIAEIVESCEDYKQKEDWENLFERA